MFTVLGMSTYGVREIALCGNDRERRSRFFWNAYMLQFLTGGIVSAAYAIYVASGIVENTAIAAVWGMYVVSAALDVSWLLFGVEEFRIPTLRAIVVKIASVVVIFAFVKNPSDLWIYCASISGSFLINQILLWPFLKRYVDISRPTLRGILACLLPNLRLFIPVVAISLYVSFSKIMLGGLSTMAETGYFEYSDKLCRMPLALITAMGTVMLPRMTAEISAGNMQGAQILLEKSIWIMLLMAIGISFWIFSVAPEFAVVFLGEGFSESSNIMRVLTFMIPLIAITNVLGRQYLIPTCRDTIFTITVSIGAVVSVALNTILIPHFAAAGAAIATVAAELTVLIAQGVYLRCELPVCTYLKNAIPFVVCGILACLITRLLANSIDVFFGDTSVLLLLILVATFAACFAILVIAWCIATKNDYAISVLKSIRRQA